MLFEHKPAEFFNLILSSNNQIISYKSGKGSLLFRVEPLTKKYKLLTRSKIGFSNLCPQKKKVALALLAIKDYR